MKSSKSISLIIPVYNEEKLIQNSILKCTAILDNDFLDYEVIIVDDGSKDKSLDIVKILSLNNEKIKIVENCINLNQGVSIQRALKFAKKEFITHNGIDLPFDPTVLRSLLEEINGFDILVLERKKYTGASNWRKIISILNIFIRKLLFPILSKNLNDLNYIQIYRSSIIPYILPLAKSPAFTTPEMIFRARYLAYKILTQKIDYNPRMSGKSSLGKLHDILWSIYDMIRFKFLLVMGLKKHGITK